MKFQMVSDKYGELHETTPEQFEKDCQEISFEVELTWHTDGDDEWYTDQDGETVLAKE